MAGMSEMSELKARSEEWSAIDSQSSIISRRESDSSSATTW